MVDLVAQLITEITELSAIDFNISRDKNDKNLASLAFNKLISYHEYDNVYILNIRH